MKELPAVNKNRVWNIGEPGGINGPFYSVVAADGRIIALQIPDKEIALLIARIPIFVTALNVETITKETK